jgi:hypothetical protein
MVNYVCHKCPIIGEALVHFFIGECASQQGTSFSVNDIAAKVILMGGIGTYRNLPSKETIFAAYRASTDVLFHSDHSGYSNLSKG